MRLNFKEKFMRRTIKKENKGITLIEILTVVAIIFALTFIAVIRFPSSFVSDKKAQILAEEAARAAQLAQRLSVNSLHRYDLEFLDKSGGTLTPYTQYRIKNYDTGNIYRDETYQFQKGVNVVPETTAQKITFYPDGNIRVLNKDGNPSADPDDIYFEGKEFTYILKVIERTGRVYVEKQ